MKALLDVKDLKVSYGSIEALKGISFKVFEGEIISLIGANGAGKTTTLRALSGLVDAGGEVFLREHNLLRTPPHLRVKLGLAQSPEGRGIFPQMTVLENLELGYYSRSDKNEIKRDLDYCYELFPRVKV
jgi:branched-chain amino acid transport system ATP-binding protein